MCCCLRARPTLATTAFGQQLFLVWPRPCLATTYFGHDLLWPRPCLATTYFGHDLTDFGHGQFGAFSRVKRGRGGVGAREWGGPRGEAAEGVGAQTQKKCGGKKGGGPKGGGPNPEKGWGQEVWGSRVFFSLSGCLLVSFFSL